MGRKCAIPYCYTGYRNCKDKLSLFRVPDDDFFYTKWNEVVARQDRPINPKDYVCEKHFTENDIVRQRIVNDALEIYQRPRLRPDAIPSIFPDLPECIPKMVRKLRKMTAVTEKVDENKNDITNTDTRIEDIQIKEEAIDCDESTWNNSKMLNDEIEIKSEECFNDDSVKCELQSTSYSYNRTTKHQCHECDYQTKFYHNLITHKSKHSRLENAYRCEQCPKFISKWKLTYNNHLKVKHGIGKLEIYACNICTFKTKVKVCLKRHMERHRISALPNFVA